MERNTIFRSGDSGLSASHNPSQPEEDDVSCSLQAVEPGKAAGLYDVPGRELKDSAEQLAGLFTFNWSLSHLLEVLQSPSIL